jgi:NAD(P)-dependent dehydrogenase (short-subunit alcohol dehydrogenase family)/acyl carrier protein
VESEQSVARLERVEIEQVLLALVSEKTGYPAEMLDRNLNLEADLGIDSIKRVEIIGALERRTGLIGAEMEQASRLGTLQALIDFLNGRLSSSTPGEMRAAVEAQPLKAATNHAPSAQEESSLKSYEPSGAGKSNGSNGSHAALPSLLTEQTPPALNEQQLTQKLLQIVSERTGYPAEMLDLDLNLEADLGVDSIKRVEIIGAFQRDCLSPHQKTSHELVERLTGIKTLRGIIETSSASLSLDITGPAGPHVAGTSPPASAKSLQGEPKLDQPKLDQSQADLPVPRFILRAVDAPLPVSEAERGVEGLLFVITDDEGDIAQSLSEALRERGGRCVLVRQGDETIKVAPGLYTANITEAASVARLFELIRERHGALSGLMHLLPLRTHGKLSELNLDQWRKGLREEVKSFFYMARAVSAELKYAASNGGGWLLAATSMGGTFGFDADDSFIFPGQGGLAGLVKTLAVEWPGVRCKAIDLERSETTALLCEHLLAEITGHDGEVEVGYTQSRRLSLRPLPAPLKPRRAGAPLIDSNSVVLVTGGARGITSEVVREMAARYRPTLLLVGRMAPPASEESEETAGLESTQEIKAALMEQLRRVGQPLTPAQVEAAYLRLMKEREFARNASSIREAGARLQYFQADVRDEHSFGQLIDEIYRAYGRLDGVIHGAGTIEDKLIEDKTPDSFDRVFDTKADSTFILSRKLRADSLKFFLAFSSVAGRFGNRGQGDYAAGNEAMNRLVAQLDRVWPGRVAALDWNPWQKGMASPQVQQQFRERGVQVVSAAAGRSAFILELEAGGKGEVEVVLGGGPWGHSEHVERVEGAERAAQPAGKAPEITAEMREALSLPLLDGVVHATAPGGVIELTRELEPSSDLYLLDHLLDERPVFPAAMAMELMAEATQRGWPDLSVVGLESFRVLKGIVLDGAGRKSLRVTARPETQPEQEELELAVDVTISEGLEKGHSYRATVLLNDHLRGAPQTDLLPPLGQLHPFQMSVAEAYERWLFHGPSLQGIASIEGINERGMLATLSPCAPARCLRRTDARAWLIDPVVMDSAFQLAILWMRTHQDMTPLPAGFRRYRLYAPLKGQSLRCDFRAQTSAGGHVLETQVVFMDEQGRVLSVLEDMEFSCSRSLNRLAGRAMMRARHE